MNLHTKSVRKIMRANVKCRNIDMPTVRHLAVGDCAGLQFGQTQRKRAPVKLVFVGSLYHVSWVAQANNRAPVPILPPKLMHIVSVTRREVIFGRDHAHQTVESKQIFW